MERVIYERIQALEQNHWWFAGRREILSTLIGDLGLPADARILEAGCGAGGNLRLLSRWSVGRWTDEPSRNTCEHWGVEVATASCPRLPMQKARPVALDFISLSRRQGPGRR